MKLGRIRHTKLMILHAAISPKKNGASENIVNSPDGDTVFVNGLGCFPLMISMFFYRFTGCDTCNAFYGTGKK